MNDVATDDNRLSYIRPKGFKHLLAEIAEVGDNVLMSRIKKIHYQKMLRWVLIIPIFEKKMINCG